MILLDTSGLLAAVNDRQRAHVACRDALRHDPGPMLLSPFVLAEIDYLLSTRYGVEAELALLDDVGVGAYQLEPFAPADVASAAAVARRFSDLEIGLADASLVVLSARHACLNLLSLDERHFRVLPGEGGQPFRMLPADAEKPA